MTASDPAGLTVAAAAELIRSRQLSPVELTEACLDRIERLDGSLNAFITVTREQALADARGATDEIARGAYRGPLHGIPMALKDLFQTAGVRTTAGSKILAEHVPAEDAHVVSRLKVAGAVLLGKQNMHEFAFGATGINPHYGPVRNPVDTGRITGGSSSGSGAAVAAGECLASLGTDTGGSVRIPASLCGIVGLKPTYGRVSRRGVVPLSWSLDHVGPMARTAEDAAIVLQAIAGGDPGDESSSREPVPDYRAALSGGVRGLRIGVAFDGLRMSGFFAGIYADLEAAVHGAIEVLERLGAEVREVDLPLLEELHAAAAAILMPEALSYHQKWLATRPDDYGEEVRHRLELASMYPAVHYVNAQRLRELAVRAWREQVFAEVDLVAVPATATAAVPIEEAGLETTLSLVRFTNPFNVLAVPAVSVPCGRTGDGLPIGLQLVGRWFDEATVLRAAHGYQMEAGR